jgi:hypothetical protein
MSEQSKIFSLNNMEKYLGAAGSLNPIVNAYQDEKVRITNNWSTELGDLGATLGTKYNKLLSDSADSYKSRIKQLLAENGVSTELVKLVKTYGLVKEREKHLSTSKAIMGLCSAVFGVGLGVGLVCTYMSGMPFSMPMVGLVFVLPPAAAAAVMYVVDLSDIKVVKNGKAEIKRMIGKEDLHKTMLALDELHEKLPASLYEIKLDE